MRRKCPSAHFTTSGIVMNGSSGRRIADIELWKSWRRNWRNSVVRSTFRLATKEVRLSLCALTINVCTFGDRKEPNQYQCITMRSPGVVVNISYRPVDGPEVVLAGRDRYRCLVASFNESDKPCSMCCLIFCDEILVVQVSKVIGLRKWYILPDSTPNFQT